MALTPGGRGFGELLTKFDFTPAPEIEQRALISFTTLATNPQAGGLEPGVSISPFGVEPTKPTLPRELELAAELVRRGKLTPEVVPTILASRSPETFQLAVQAATGGQPMAIDIGGILGTVTPFLSSLPGIGGIAGAGAQIASGFLTRPSAGVSSFLPTPGIFPTGGAIATPTMAAVPAVVAAGGAVARAAPLVAQAAARLRQVLGNNWASAGRFILQTSGAAYLAQLVGMGSNQEAVATAVIKRAFKRHRRGISARDLRIANRTIRRMHRFQTMLSCKPKRRCT